MGVLPDDVLEEIIGDQNELTADITFGTVPAVTRRAYLLTSHADGYDVDIDQLVMVLPQSQLPATVSRNTVITYDGRVFSISEINPDESGVVNLTVRQLTPDPE